MKPFAVAVLLIALLAGEAVPARAASLSEDDQRIYRAAFSTAGAGRWADAHAQARQAKARLLAKVLKWMDYVRPGTEASFAEIADFVRENPDWPQPRTLARRAEDAMLLGEPNESMLAWFVEHPPETTNGNMAWARMLFLTRQANKAIEVVRETWINKPFGKVQEKQFLDLYGKHLRPEEHRRRLDRLLWDRQDDAARAMFPRVDPGYRLAAEARLQLAKAAPGAEAALGKVPAELRNDPGLVYERVRWRRKQELYGDAISLLSGSGADKGRPDLWWTERAALAREALQAGWISKAYAVASRHGDLESSQLAEAEWLAGWIALRWLKDREPALAHFKRMYDAVSSPISRARAAYWAGRAAEDTGRKTEAAEWYRKAAPHVTTYYGQLAAGRLGGEGPLALPDDPLPSAADIDGFGKHELAQAIGLLAEIGAREQIRAFVLRLGELARTPGEHALTARLAGATGRPDVAVALARRSAQDGVILVGSGYPLINVPDGGAEKAIVHAIIRQESNFHAAAVSSAGARGLMQLLPSTAKQVAKRAKVPFQPQKLTTDPALNVTLGSAFMAQLIESFSGSYVLSVAAYNAGPGRVRQWIRQFGDPRAAAVDVVDWVEMIPFTETRNYVQRVLEGVQVYRRRLGQTQLRLSLDKDLKR